MADGKTLKPFLTAAEIDTINRRLAEKISAEYADKVSEKSELIIVVTLKGALFFAADLLRHIKLPCRVDFVRAASYGTGTKSSGFVKVTKEVESDVAGHHVLILDEIVDTGRTLRLLADKLRYGSPKSLRVCALLSKPSRREVNIAVDFIGREIPDHFVVGYGLDFGEKYRTLKDIYVLEG